MTYKSLLISASLGLLLLLHTPLVHAAGPFHLQSYGKFKKMVHLKKVGGVVDLKTALSGSHRFAVGAIKKGEGEITVVDSKVWLAYGREGPGKATRVIPEGEQAVLLVTAQVEEWQSIVVPKTLSESEMHHFVLEQAKKKGLDTKAPFPFLFEGPLASLKWHVINGLNPEFRGHGGPPLFHQFKENREKTSGTVIGFYSAGIQGVFTHPGESWHLHILFWKEEKAGHVDEVVVGKGAVLKLPEI